MPAYQLTREQLLSDLYQAYLDARRHKRNRHYQLTFEANLNENLNSLCDELWTRTYQPRPSTCFIITDPKKREVFAADFRDRIVHHLYYNYVHEMLERTFVQDSYSCIKGRGTHYGIDRLEQHIRQESQNYQQSCYVLKMDIQGYFMHIRRERLLEFTLSLLRKMSSHKVNRRGAERWNDRVDMDFVEYLTREIILLDCTRDCIIKGNASDWDDLPYDKSLFHSPEGCGLPIGNLTSQLFSNVYMNEFDQYMKRTLGCRHYGRYVDDFYVVSADREWLKSIIPEVKTFLSERLGLTLHPGKLRIDDVRSGVEFLGGYLKPWRRYVSRVTLARMLPKMQQLEQMDDPFALRSRLNSMLGVLCHYRSWHLQRHLVLGLNSPWLFGQYRLLTRGYRYEIV